MQNLGEDISMNICEVYLNLFLIRIYFKSFPPMWLLSSKEKKCFQQNWYNLNYIYKTV